VATCATCLREKTIFNTIFAALLWSMKEHASQKLWWFTVSGGDPPHCSPRAQHHWPCFHSPKRESDNFSSIQKLQPYQLKRTTSRVHHDFSGRRSLPKLTPFSLRVLPDQGWQATVCTPAMRTESNQPCKFIISSSSNEEENDWEFNIWHAQNHQQLQISTTLITVYHTQSWKYTFDLMLWKWNADVSSHSYMELLNSLVSGFIL